MEEKERAGNRWRRKGGGGQAGYTYRGVQRNLNKGEAFFFANESPDKSQY